MSIPSKDFEDTIRNDSNTHYISKRQSYKKNNKKETMNYLRQIITRRIKKINMSKNFRHVSHLGDANTFKHRFYSPNNFYNSDVFKNLMINRRYYFKSQSRTRNQDSHNSKFDLSLK